jgi:hypothetical protein
LLPEGAAAGVLVLGDGCPPALAPDDRARAARDTVDLVIVAPSRSQRRDARWAHDAATVAASRLSRAGIAYVVPAGARRLRRALATAGLPLAATLLHVPNVAVPRYLVPVGTAAERWALAGGIAMRRGKRFLAVSLGSRGRTAIAPTGAVHRRDPGMPLAGWLHHLDGEKRPPGGMVVALPHGATGGAIVFRFPTGRREPDAVAKLTPGARAEHEALRRIAPHAGDAGARVPVALASDQVGTTPFVLESAVGGRRAADLVASGSVEPTELQGRLADWLEAWHLSAARPRPIGQDDVDRFLLGPASRAAVGVGHLELLRELGSRAVGRSCPFVPAHGDLTLANVLVADSEALGVVDWEHASEESLPLMDLLYAGVDAVAARRKYADRPGAFRACFDAENRGASALEGLRSSAARALDLDEVVQTFCFHACWLHHAANETDRSAGSTRGPFSTILDTIAQTPERFGLPLPAQ